MSFRQIVAEETGFPLERVAAIHPRTDRLPPTRATVGSDSIQDFGPLLAKASAALAAALKQDGVYFAAPPSGGWAAFVAKPRILRPRRSMRPGRCRSIALRRDALSANRQRQTRSAPSLPVMRRSMPTTCACPAWYSRLPCARPVWARRSAASMMPLPAPSQAIWAFISSRRRPMSRLRHEAASNDASQRSEPPGWAAMSPATSTARSIDIDSRIVARRARTCDCSIRDAVGAVRHRSPARCTDGGSWLDGTTHGRRPLRSAGPSRRMDRNAGCASSARSLRKRWG